MHALALTAAQDRSAQERLVARASDRIEILSPRRDDARAAARRYHEAASRYAELRFARDEPHWQRRAPLPETSAHFLAQHMAQQQPGNGAHVENWRGARAAYSRAGVLAGAAGANLSILI
jgi:hypothetical protein